MGKSTLMNALVGERLSIITSKAQTTRHRIMGIVNGDDFQIVYSDTPGILNPNYKLQESMMRFVRSALSDADVLLHVIDVSHELYKEQAAAVYQVLDELGAKDKTIITVYNKIDKLPPDSGLAERLSKEENSICISAKARYNLDGLLALIAENLKLKAVEESFLVPYSDSAAVGRLHDAGTVLEQEYLAEGTLLKVRLDAEQVQQFAKYLAADAKA